MSEEPAESGGEVRNNASTTHVVGRPFQPGNPGRPKGSRHKATIAIEALLQGQAEGLTQKAIEKALEGDNFALKLCLDRLAPPRRDATVTFALPKMETAADALAALSAIADAVATGEISPIAASGSRARYRSSRPAIPSA